MAQTRLGRVSFDVVIPEGMSVEDAAQHSYSHVLEDPGSFLATVHIFEEQDGIADAVLLHETDSDDLHAP